MHIEVSAEKFQINANLFKSMVAEILPKTDN